MAKRSDPGFRVIVSLTDKFTAPIKAINRSIAESTAKVRAIAAVPGAIMKASGLDKIGGAVANVGRSFGNLRNQIAGAVAPFARLATLGAGIGLVTATVNAVKLGDELVNLSTKTGWSIDSLQRFQYAAKQSGVDMEAFNGSITRLQKAIAAGRKGDKGVLEAFTKGVGISAAELKALKPEEIFLRVADAISNMQDPVHRTETAMKIFGKSGADLISMLAEGGPEIRRLGEELARTGAIMSDDTARGAKAFGDMMLKLGHYIQGVAYAVLGELLPAMKEGAQGLDDWLDANREWLTTTVVDVVKELAGGAMAFGRVIRDDVMPAIASLKPIWQAFSATIGEGNTVLLAFTAVVAPGIIGALFGIVKAVAALGVALVANPIGAAIVAIVAAIAGAAYLIWRYWDEIKAAFTAGVDFVVDAWDSLIALIAGFDLDASLAAIAGWWSDLKATFSAGIDFVVGAWNRLSEAFSAGDLDAIVAELAGWWDAIKGVFVAGVDLVLSIWAGLGDALGSALGFGAIGTAFTDALRDLGAAIGGAFDLGAVGTALAGWWASIEASFASGVAAVLGLWGRLGAAIGGALDLGAIGGTVAAWWGSIADAFGAGIATVTGLWDRFAAWFLGTDLGASVASFAAGYWRAIETDFAAGIAVVTGLWNSFATWFGETSLGKSMASLAGYWDEIAGAFENGIATLTSIWNGFLDFVGTLGGLLVASLAAPAQQIGEVFDQLVALVADFAGRLLAPLAQLGEAIKVALTGPLDFIMAQWNNLVGFLTGAVGKVTGLFAKVGGWVGLGGGAPAAPTGAPVLPSSPGIAAAGAGGAQQSRTDINVDFSNVPTGTRISERSSGPADVSLDTQYAGGRGALAGAF
jgi:hypothetical protein